MSFSNMSGDPAQTYFSDGIAEELRGALSRIGIPVIGKASTENREIVDRADESAKQAVALMPGSGRPIVMLAEISVNRLDYSTAMCGFEKALATQPSDGFVLAKALNNLTYLSNGLKALALAYGFIALDPLNSSAQLIRGICLLLLRRYAAAIEDRPIAADRRPRRPVRRKGCRASVRLGTMFYSECRPRPRGEAAKLIVSLNGKAPTAARPLTTEAV